MPLLLWLWLLRRCNRVARFAVSVTDHYRPSGRTGRLRRHRWQLNDVRHVQHRGLYLRLCVFGHVECVERVLGTVRARVPSPVRMTLSSPLLTTHPCVPVVSQHPCVPVVSQHTLRSTVLHSAREFPWRCQGCVPVPVGALTADGRCVGFGRDSTQSLVTGSSSCGVMEDYQSCTVAQCTRNCTVTEWSLWSLCSGCGQGSSTRTRYVCVCWPMPTRQCLLLNVYCLGGHYIAPAPTFCFIWDIPRARS